MEGTSGGLEDDQGKEGKDKAAAHTKSAGSHSTGSSRREAGGDGTGEARLWVDKYSPKTFSQLLSDEAINREVTEESAQVLSGKRRSLSILTD